MSDINHDLWRSGNVKDEDGSAVEPASAVISDQKHLKPSKAILCDNHLSIYLRRWTATSTYPSREVGC